MYTLHLTKSDMATLNWVNNRYAWSEALLTIAHAGHNKISEPNAWALRDAFLSDSSGTWHASFPCLDQGSTLAAKLYKFMEKIT